MRHLSLLLIIATLPSWFACSTAPAKPSVESEYGSDFDRILVRAIQAEEARDWKEARRLYQDLVDRGGAAQAGADESIEFEGRRGLDVVKCLEKRSGGGVKSRAEFETELKTAIDQGSARKIERLVDCRFLTGEPDSEGDWARPDDFARKFLQFAPRLDWSSRRWNDRGQLVLRIPSVPDEHALLDVQEHDKRFAWKGFYVGTSVWTLYPEAGTN